MESSTLCPISGETPQEERINYFTHLFGLILSFIGVTLLLIWSHFQDNYWPLLSTSIYGMTLVLLYTASTYYHRCKVLHRKRIYRVMDHVCIYLLIAGTYTPFALGPLRNDHGLEILAVEWTIAIIGILFKIFAFDRFQYLSVVAYMGMGWLIAFNFPHMIESLPFDVFYLLIAGGISYTLGTVFYLLDRIPFNHGIWHMFVLGGSTCHFLSIFFLVDAGLML